MNHDPILHSNYLRQCLSQEKRRLSVFIGAGCPTAIRVKRVGQDEPLIPDIVGITAKVCEELDKGSHKGLLKLVESHFAADGLSKPNIEAMLSHIRSLRQVAGKDFVRGCKAQDLDDLDIEICSIIAKLANENLPNHSTPYHQLAAWIGAIQRTFSVELFTTNYDLLCEQALEHTRVPYFDGFVGTHKTFFDLQAMEDDLLPNRWARLWKIHGSLNWFEDKDGSIHRGQPTGPRRVIYPSHLKYDESRRMPYLAMIDRLRSFLKQPTCALLTVGYSFGDKHLNEVIVQALQGNPTAVVFALLFGPLSKYGSAMALATNRSNLNLFAEDEAVIGTKRCSWPNGRDPGSCPPNSVAVKWVDDPAKGGAKRASFQLGDFNNLGDFLQELIGEKEMHIVI